jgi:sucrose-6-phosphatase
MQATTLFVTDLDNTLVGDRLALAELNQWLVQRRQGNGLKLVYATGRSLRLYRQLTQEQVLLQPDALIASVGTEIYIDDFRDGLPRGLKGESDPHWVQRLSQGWNREQVEAVASQLADLIPQANSEQRPFKVSYLLAEAKSKIVLTQLDERFQSADLAVDLIYSGGQDLDILPRGANKGSALAFLQHRWGIGPKNTLVCGDSGNDIALFDTSSSWGILVGNARSELRDWHDQHPSSQHYLATLPYAQGLLEGLRYFGWR